MYIVSSFGSGKEGIDGTGAGLINKHVLILVNVLVLKAQQKRLEALVARSTLSCICLIYGNELERSYTFLIPIIESFWSRALVGNAIKG